jgi:hypothetical protein
MGILQDLERGVRASISASDAVDWLSSFEDITCTQAATWLNDHCIVDALMPVFISWHRLEYGPKTQGIRDEPSTDEVRSILRDGLAHIEAHGERLEENPSLGGMKNVGWLRDEFWQFVLEKGVTLTAEMFPEISQCPSFLHAEFMALEIDSITGSPVQKKGSLRGAGLRASYEDMQGEYIEFARATYLVANIEQVPFDYAASWLIENGAHRELTVYDRADPAFKPHRVELLKAGADREFSYGPLGVLHLIRLKAERWYDAAGVMQREANNELCWSRDQFWQFAIDKGANVGAQSFAMRADCPTFLLRDWTPQLEKAELGTDEEAGLTMHRLDAAGWRTYAQQAQARAEVLESRNAQLAKRIEQLEAGRVDFELVSAGRIDGLGDTMSAASMKEEISKLRREIERLKGSGKGRPGEREDGVTISLPHATTTLTGLFEVMHASFGRYDPRNPPKQTGVARDLDERMGWSAQANGEPSRRAQTLAAAIRPDDLSESDGRNQKR